MVSNIFYFHNYLGKMNPIWRAYFSNGLVQPPTRRDLKTSHKYTHTNTHTVPIGASSSWKTCQAATESIPADTPYAKIGSLKDVVWKAQVVVWQDVRASCHMMNFTWKPLKVEGRCLKYFGVSTLFFGGDFKSFLCSPRSLGKMNPIWRAYFSNRLGLVQPPTTAVFKGDVWRGHFLSKLWLTTFLQYTEPGKKRQNLQLNQLRCGLLR